MKKRLFTIGLVFTLLTTLLISSISFAGEDENPGPKSIKYPFEIYMSK